MYFSYQVIQAMRKRHQKQKINFPYEYETKSSNHVQHYGSKYSREIERTVEEFSRVYALF